jgi:hypothetical protein
MSAIAHTLAASMGAALAPSPPARGAPIGDILWASAVATVLSAAVLWIASAHRAGRITWLARAAATAQRLSGLPGWAALPLLVTGAAQGVAVFGFYWDVAKHIDTGRDPGPFGTAAHYPILLGLAGITLGGFLAIVLGAYEENPSAVHIARDWRAPIGGLLIFLCGSTALIGFPLDDVWHTLFGQDVTLWGPTHVLMVAGASLSVIGAWVLLIEGARARRERAPSSLQSLLLRQREIALAGAFLIALSTLQGEFDYGIPQFQLVYQPILIALATSAALVAARVRLGRGGAVGAALFYLAVYGLLSFTIHDVIGGSTLHFPLYLPEAVLVELAAWRLEKAVRTPNPIALGAISGALIGTLGLAVEWGWTHIWMPLPWPTSILPEAAILGLLAALAGGVLGGFIGGALDRGRRSIRPAESGGTEPRSLGTGRWSSGTGSRSVGADTGPPNAGTGPPSAGATWAPAWLAGLAGAVAVACIAYPMGMNVGAPMSATAQLKTVNGGPHRTVMASFRLSPANAANHAQWVTVTAWQGGGLVVDRLRRTAPGVYATTQPIPVYGKWKTMLRIANGRALDAIPIYLPEDSAIPAAEVPAPDHFTRTFVRDKKILQRESVGGALWLAIPAYLLLLAIAAVWMAALAWGLRRLGLPVGAHGAEERTRQRRFPPIAGRGVGSTATGAAG